MTLFRVKFRISRQHPESSKKDTFTLKCLKITLLLAKRALFCKILQRAASDYRTLITSGLLPAIDIVIIKKFQLSSFNDTTILFELVIELILPFEYLFCSSRFASKPILKLLMVSARGSPNLCLLQNLVFRDCLQSNPFTDLFSF